MLNQSTRSMQILAAFDPPADLDWQFFREGIEVAWIYRHGADGPAAAYLRYQPGASVPLHEHTGYEHILVLSGAQIDQTGEHKAGEMLISPPGSRHSITSPEGCTVLAIWERPVVFKHSSQI